MQSFKKIIDHWYYAEKTPFYEDIMVRNGVCNFCKILQFAYYFTSIVGWIQEYSLQTSRASFVQVRVKIAAASAAGKSLRPKKVNEQQRLSIQIHLSASKINCTRVTSFLN
jgi:hypothetical protein